MVPDCLDDVITCCLRCVNSCLDLRLLLEFCGFIVLCLAAVYFACLWTLRLNVTCVFRLM